MSKHETPMILRYWETIGGTLIEEFHVTPRTPTSARRLIDAVILPNQENRRVSTRERGRISIEGEEVLVVQAKAKRLGMYLAGQAFFSAKLIKRFKPRSVRSVALCKEDDTVLRSLLKRHGVEVIINSGSPVSSRTRGG